MSGKIWIQYNRVLMKDGKVIMTDRCPCDCEPRVIASKKLNGDTGPKCWDLRPFTGDGIGTPYGRWRLIEVDDPRDCGGSHYGEGEINDCGKLVGLQEEFCSGFSYDGFMELQQGCYDFDIGKWEWPCPEDSGQRYT